MKKLFWFVVAVSFCVGLENIPTHMRGVLALLAVLGAARIAAEDFGEVCEVAVAATIAALTGNWVHAMWFTSGGHNMAWEACLFYGVALFFLGGTLGFPLRLLIIKKEEDPE